MTASFSESRAARALAILLASLVISFSRVALAAPPDDDDADDARSAAAAMRFPQPVRVGALIGRTVLQPLESQPKLGSVDRVVKDDKGGIILIVNYGGVFGFWSRPIAVPVGAMALLGQDVEIIGFTPDQLKSFPIFQLGHELVLSNEEVVRVGLAKPSH